MCFCVRSVQWGCPGPTWVVVVVVVVMVVALTYIEKERKFYV